MEEKRKLSKEGKLGCLSLIHSSSQAQRQGAIPIKSWAKCDSNISYPANYILSEYE